MMEFIINNYLLIVLIVGFSLLLTNNLQIDKSKANRLRELLVLVALMTIFNSLENHFATFDHYNYGRLICSFICYSLRPLVVISFILILTDHKIVKYSQYLTALNALIYSTCFFSDIAFSFTEKNYFTRGPLGYTAHILCIFYLIELLIILLKKYNSQNKIHTYIPLFMTISCIIAAYLDSLGDISLFDNTILVCILIYYLFSYMEYNKMDALTQTLNRSSFYYDISKLEKKITSVLSIDMNNLKKTNDTYGHLAGDEALKTISAIFKEVDKNKIRVYRVGGDEFVVLAFYLQKEQIEDYISKVKEKLKKTKYTCSFGYEYTDGKTDIYELYKKADDKMYKEKEAFHQKEDKRN